MADKEYTPDWIKQWVVDQYIDAILNFNKLDPKQYSLSPDRRWVVESDKYIDGVKTPLSPKNVKPASKKLKSDCIPTKSAGKKLKPWAKPPKISESIESKVKELGEKYVLALLTKKGFDIVPMQPGFGYDLIALSPDSKKTLRYNIIIERQLQSTVIGIELLRIVNDETVLNINTTLADYYTIKICGMPGVYQISTGKLKELINNYCLERVKMQYANGYYNLAVINRNVILDNATYIM